MTKRKNDKKTKHMESMHIMLQSDEIGRIQIRKYSESTLTNANKVLTKNQKGWPEIWAPVTDFA